MSIFILLILFCIFCILITMTTTLISIAFKIVTRTNFKVQVLIFPAILSLLIWGTLAIVFHFIVIKILGQNIFAILLDCILNFTDLKSMILKTLGIIITFSLIGIILQGLAFLTANIPYRKLWYAIKKKLKIKEKDTVKKLEVALENKEQTSINSNDNNIEEKTQEIIENKEAYPDTSKENKLIKIDEKINLINALISSLFLFSIIFFLSIIFFSLGHILSNTVMTIMEKIL